MTVNALSMVNLYRDKVIPRTQEALKVSQNGYESDKTTFLDLLDTQRMYLDAEKDYYRNITDYQKSKANLEKMVGTDLP
jgi:outer membrane protein TolC